MKILYISQYFWPEPVHFNDLIYEFSKKHQITVITANPNFPLGKMYEGYKNKILKKEIQKNLIIYRILTFPNKSYSIVKRFLNYFVFSFLASLISPLIAGKFDVIFSVQGSPVFYLLPCVINKKIFKKKLVIWVQDLWPETLASLDIIGKNSFIYRILDRFCVYLYKNCDFIFLESPGFIRILSQKGIPIERMEFLPNWSLVSFGSLKQGKIRQEFDFIKNDTSFKMLYAGGVGKFQRLDILLDALKQLESKNISLYIAGDGPELVNLKRYSKRLGMTNVIFLGRIQPDTMPTLYDIVDVLFFQLKKDYLFKHTIPSKLQAYMASGKPIIGAIEGSSADIINEAKCGIVVGPENIYQIQEAIIMYSKFSKAKLEEIGIMGQQYSKKCFSKDAIIDRIEKKIKNFYV